MNRRDFIAAATSAITLPYSLALPAFSALSKSEQPSLVLNTLPLNVEHHVELKAAHGQAQLAPDPYNKTPVWCYNDSVPGPEIRVKQGQRIRVLFKNKLQQASTIHWHGVRTPNAMDGVPDLTQIPVAPESDFSYEFDAIDAGTFWYHPHQRSFEQVGRGLYGPLIVEEANPIRVDRDLTWVLDDWRLVRSAAIRNDFGNGHDMSHNGRVGNTVTINGRAPDRFTVQKGERIRLRLINAANARIFELDFDRHRPVVIALDGQPVDPHTPEGGRIILGPAMRVDLIIDMTGNLAQRNTVTDVFYKDLEYRLIDIQYADTALRDDTPDWPMTLLANPLAEPNLQQATRHSIQFSGGMMGQMVLQEMGIQTDQTNAMGMKSMREMMHSKKMWFINGIAAEGHIMEPMLTLQRNQHTIIDMTNATAWYHPMHLHGHSFRVLSRNGVPTKYREWRDTVLMAPRERVEIAFVADNPGDWMFHCHILEHSAAGMMGVIRVT
jgi:FtsP/CotA-like multicopper oxidase with cupredoxin domain